MNCKGKNNPMYGRKHSEETKKKMRLKALGENNVMWKGDKVGDNPLHIWIKQRLIKPELCQCCETRKPYDLANYTGIYTRDLDNWIYLCRSCHMKLDIKTGVRKY